MTTEYKPTIDYSKVAANMANQADKQFKEDIAKQLLELNKKVDALSQPVSQEMVDLIGAAVEARLKRLIQDLQRPGKTKE